MKDFKYLDNKARSVSANRRRQAEPAVASREPVSRRRSTPRFRLLAPVLFILLAGYPLVSLFIPTKTASSSVSTTSPSYSRLNCGQALGLGVNALGTCRFQDGSFQAPLPDGATALYTMDEELQSAVSGMMADYQVPYAVFVAMEPKTGRVLAMASHSSVDPAWGRHAFYELFPLASLFKIITASAALEQNEVNAGTVFAYRGRLTSESPRLWELGNSRRNPEMTLADAMGKSVNPVFGRLAGDVVGTDAMMGMASRFGFNEPLFPGSPLPASRAERPADRHQLMLMGAGLGREVKASPFHAAAIMAGIANRGMLMAPSLLAEIRGGDGDVLYRQAPTPVRQLVNVQTVAELDRMLLTTVSKGTSRRAFHDRRGRLKLADVQIAAKTGSIDGVAPGGHYSWFAAYAPVEDPRIALVALVINQNRWRIKGVHLGERALETFFR
jgi:cell division protein FtsI/penicillin-binding protein 2